jgi:hypothetical protein
VIAYTIVSRAYVPHARVLARSYARHHPDAPLWALLIDDLHGHVNEAEEPFRVLRLGDLALDTSELHRMAMLFGGRLIAAIKPWVFDHFLDRGAESVLYIDSDVLIFDSLHAVGEAARQHGVALIPHVITPMPRDGRKPDETMVLGVGTFNAGMLGVGPLHGGFLAFLKERLRRECRTDIDAMRVNEQRWLDFVPPLFTHQVVRDPGVDVAPWNLHERPLTKVGDRLFAAGVPLRAFHFSGFDPRVPSVLSARDYWDNPRVPVAGHTESSGVVEQYRTLLFDAGFTSCQGVPFAFDFLPDGTAIPASLRALYTDALLAAERTGAAEPPDPFDPSMADAFGEWCVAAYAAVGMRMPFFLHRENRGEHGALTAVDGGMTVGEAGRRESGNVIVTNVGDVGFVGFCPRLTLGAGMYRFVVDATVTDPVPAAGIENGLDQHLVVDLAISGRVIACHQIERNGDRPFEFSVSIPDSLEALALSAGVDVRFFTHGGVRASFDAVLMEEIGQRATPGGVSEPRDIDWLIEMTVGDGGTRHGREIWQAAGERGLLAMGPHWWLPTGRYRADARIMASEYPENADAVVCSMEALVDGHVAALRNVFRRDLGGGAVSMEFDVSRCGESATACVEFRLRGESTVAVIVRSLSVASLGSSNEGFTPCITNWLPALWLHDAGRREGDVISAVPEHAGVIAVGPHWRIARGQYNVVAEIATGDPIDRAGTTSAGDIAVLVDGQVAASQSIEAGRPLNNPFGEAAQMLRLEFEVANAPDADVELRLTTTGEVSLIIRALEVHPVSSDVGTT